jgi:hypothetical protein
VLETGDGRRETGDERRETRYEMRYLPLVSLVAVVAALGACDSMSEPEQACNDVINWTTDVVYRCTAGDLSQKAAARDEARDQLQSSLQCEKAKQIRDKDGLYGCCSSWFKSVSCTDFAKGAAVMPSCCKSQIMM